MALRMLEETDDDDVEFASPTAHDSPNSQPVSGWAVSEREDLRVEVMLLQLTALSVQEERGEGENITI